MPSLHLEPNEVAVMIWTPTGWEAPSPKYHKAVVMLMNRRIRFTSLTSRTTSAWVVGTTATYTVEFAGRWRCSCPNERLCSHIIAVQSVYRLVAPALGGGDNG